MQRFVWFLIIGMTLAGVAGCGGNKDEGINKGKDKPKSQQPR